MKKDDLIHLRDRANRVLYWFFGLVFLGVVFLMVGFAVVPPAFRWEANAAGAIYTISALWIIIRISNHFDVKCPHCKRSLQSSFFVALALTTGKCGHCGEVVVDES